MSPLLCRLQRCCFGIRRKCIIFPLLLILLIGAALTALLPPSEEHGGVAGVLGVLRRAAPPKGNPAQGQPADAPEEKFTIVIQTYNRTDVLLKLLNHYQAVPHLQMIIIVWNNIREQTPAKLWESLGPHPVPVVFKEQASNQMRNRLQPFSEIATNGQCIFNLHQFAMCKIFIDFIYLFFLFHFFKPETCHSADRRPELDNFCLINY